MQMHASDTPPRSSDALSSAPDAPFWSIPAEVLLTRLQTAASGLSSAEAKKKLGTFGPNRVSGGSRETPLRLFLRQFTSPLVLILVAGALVALGLRKWLDASIILIIVIASGLLGFYQEYRASRAMAALRARLAATARAMRDGTTVTVPTDSLVPGDVIELNAGDLVPADAVLLQAKDFLVTEASLTGESFPVEKHPGAVPADSAPAERTNAVFAGCSVRSGTAKVLIVKTGRETAFGTIAATLRQAEPETEFARGVRHFGTLLLRVMTVIVVFVLLINELLGRPAIDSLLFAVALAVGLSPELLPAFITVSLSNGAHRLAQHGVIVRRLAAIESLGSFDVLCTDKTGTLTRADIELEGACDADGDSSPEVLRLAFLNACLQTGIDNPLDAALLAAGQEAGLPIPDEPKIDEIPYDFARRSLSVVVARTDGDGAQMITKGAFDNVLTMCGQVRHSL